MIDIILKALFRFINEMMHELLGLAMVMMLFSVNSALDYSSPYEQNQIGIHPLLLPYVNSFERDGQRLKGLPFMIGEMNIHFQKDIKGTILAWCRDSADKKFIGITVYRRKPRIMVDRKVWDGLTVIQREQLMYHELGHCALDRDHLDEVHNKEYVSLMHSSGFIEDANYIANRDQYLNELFNGQVNEKAQK